MKKSLVPLQSLRLFLCVFVISLISGLAPTHSFASSIPFTKNMGQWPDSILYRASANGATMWFTKNGIWYQFFKTMEKAEASKSVMGGPPSGWVPANLLEDEASSGPNSSTPSRVGKGPGVRSYSMGGGRPFLPLDQQPDSILTTMVKAEFVGASSSVEVVGLEEREYKCNYFIGNDESQWRSNVPNYTTVTLKGLYPGVDVSFSSKDGLLREEMTASSREALAQVKIEYCGASSVTPLTSSSTIVQTSLGEHQFDGIMLADQSSTKFDKPTASSASISENAVSVVYSTYLGGSGGSRGYGIAVDSSGSAYVSGETWSVEFPTQNPYQVSGGGTFSDVFVTKFSPSGTELIYSSYLGGSGGDVGYDIAVDVSGNAYITGQSQSPNFPVRNQFQGTYGGGYDAFVAKLSSVGSGLEYSTYLGGNKIELSYGIAVDGEGNAHIAGLTISTDFPTQNPFQPTFGGGSDGFVSKFNRDGNGLIFSTYLGGSIGDACQGVAVDVAGNTYVAGGTYSVDFPTQNPFQASLGSLAPSDAFVTRFSVSGDVTFSTYLGGSGSDYGIGVATDFAENVYVTGHTQSSDFPIQNPLQPLTGGSFDAFVTKLNAVGNRLIYSTYLGGSGQEDGYKIAVDATGNAFVTGMTDSDDFPTVYSAQAVFGYGGDGFVARLSTSGRGLSFSTYLGGGAFEISRAIAVGADGAAYATGVTYSDNFPTQNPYQPSLSGYLDAFVTKFMFVPCCLGSRGNVNGDAGDAVNVADITFLVQYLFQNGAEPPCTDEANVAVNGTLNIIDITTLVSYLMAGGPPPPACP